MGKTAVARYIDYSIRPEAAPETGSEPSILRYTDLAGQENYMFYGSEGQAAVEAIPVEIPVREERPEQKEEPQYRPMPAAGIRDEIGHVARRRRPRTLSAVLFGAAALGLALVLFRVVAMHGEINALAIETGALQSELTSLQKEESTLRYQLAGVMTEVEMKDRAVHELKMVRADADNTVGVRYSEGDVFEIGAEEAETPAVLAFLTDTFGDLAQRVWGFLN